MRAYRARARARAPRHRAVTAPLIGETDESASFWVLDPTRPVWTVGRSPHNDIVLPSDRVSKRHARIELRDGAWWVCDLDSTNDTRLGGRPIQSARVERCTHVHFASARVYFGSRQGCQRRVVPGRSCLG